MKNLQKNSRVDTEDDLNTKITWLVLELLQNLVDKVAISPVIEHSSYIYIYMNYIHHYSGHVIKGLLNFHGYICTFNPANFEVSLITVPVDIYPSEICTFMHLL